MHFQPQRTQRVAGIINSFWNQYFLFQILQMNRKTFIKSVALTGLAGATMKLSALNKITNPLSSTDQMPVLFLGHGSPMNAIEENEFVAGFRKVGKEIPKPQAILVVS